MSSFKNLIYTIALAANAVSVFNTALAQQNDENHLLWSSTRRLKARDFAMQPHEHSPTNSFAQFVTGYKANGLSILGKNINEKVTNYMITSASYIDTSNLDQLLAYHQTLFDLLEISARQLRKELKKNRTKIALGINMADELNDKNTIAHAKRRAAYDKETDYGQNPSKQKEWVAVIQKELDELSDYAYEK